MTDEEDMVALLEPPERTEAGVCVCVFLTAHLYFVIYLF